MPSRDRVIPWRKVLQNKLAIFTGHCKIGVLEYSDITLHPGMYIAFHWNCDFLPAKGCLYGGHSRCLKLIPLAIVTWQWVDIVCRGVAILDKQFLSNLQSDYMRTILATLLFNDGWFLWSIERAPS